ncbi:unnamed protein product [Arctia plantaginis]|uniref:Methyltransferase domain-containing protein n=1 Tax=Arctia plantaginis TaxID=874455 RepID=A0A8S0YU98_ARCPL|nr:unnamed protein product [Arctia plantaginis]CAB3247933.1 unnamed protein product [Arctia plantaginis]
MNNPELYQECNIIQKTDALSSLKKYASKLKWKKNNNKVVDLGCGDGSVTNILMEFLPTDYQLLGCDISENMVMYASNHHRNERTSFTLLDISGHLPKRMRGYFDHVFSFYALNWVADQKKAFENIFNLLDYDGQCLLTLAGYHTIHDVYRILSRNSKWSTWINDVEKYISPYHDSENPDASIMKLMQAIGFVDCHVECRDMVFSYENEDIMRKHTLAVNPFRIPAELHDDFIVDYIQALKDIAISRNAKTEISSKGFTLYYKLLILYGRKPTISEI